MVELGAAAADEMQRQWGRPGPLAAGRSTIDQWCRADGAEIAVTVHHPLTAPATSRPAVVFCHGLGGGRELYQPIGTHLASHGIVSIHPEFDDAFDRVKGSLGLTHVSAETWPTDETARAALHQLLFDPVHWRSRARRVGAVIDAIGEHDLLGLDAGPVVAAGHSFGAFTAQMLAGVHLIDAVLGDEEFGHPAVGGAALLSPQGSGSRGLQSHSWVDVTVPLVVVTATNDFGAGGEGLTWRREPFDAAPARHKWLLVAKGWDHGLGGVVSARTEPRDDAVVEQIAGSIAALAASVGGDNAARGWLDDQHRPDLFEHDAAGAEK